MKTWQGVAVAVLAASPSAALADPFDDFDDDEIEVLDAVERVEGPASWSGEGFPLTGRAVNMPLGTVARHRSLTLLVDHRTQQSFTESPFQSMLGFDAGSLKIGLGLRLGLFDLAEVGVYRLNNGVDRFDGYHFDAKFQLLQAAEHWVDLSVIGGLSWFAQENTEDAGAGFAQLAVSRQFADRMTAGCGLMYHSDSSNAVKSNADEASSLAGFITMELRAHSWIAWSFEGAYAVAGYRTTGKKGITGHPVLTSAVKFVTNRHTFAIVVTNSQYTGADGLPANTPRALDELVLGFSISREWNL